MSNNTYFGFSDFETAFKIRLSDFVKKKINKFNFRAQKLYGKERDNVLLKIIKTLLNPEVVKAGKRRKLQWEKGWRENLERNLLIPLYFGKYDVVRWRAEFFKAKSANFELNMLQVLEYSLFDKYLKKFKTIYEFGCGTGHNLLRVREVNSKAEIWGLDWAKSSQKIIETLNSERIFAKNFDFFKPDRSFKLNKNSAIFTVAALEQIGGDFNPFIEYLLDQKPKICIHIEPIAELLDENNLVDYLSILYFKKRNYLNGFLTKLRELEKKKKIKILRAQRTFIGSLYIEGYSVIVWSPV